MLSFWVYLWMVLHFMHLCCKSYPSILYHACINNSDQFVNKCDIVQFNPESFSESNGFYHIIVMLIKVRRVTNANSI